MRIDEQVEYLMQGTEYGDETLKQTMTQELRQRLMEADKEGRPLRVYCGYDPRRADLHLGHTVTMRKLRQFQELGHEVTFLIGNYTSLVGDPSDKDVLRPRMTQEEIDENSRTYAEQAFRILDPQKTVIRYNAEWLSKLSLEQMIHLASNFTLQQFLTRDNFKQRWEHGDAVYLHETFYAIMQGYDAYAMRSDVQVGGTDQLFNIVTAARKLMSYLGEKPNIAIILGILPGTDGVIRMSKSLGNHIPLNTTAEDMYGKVMSVPDAAMGSYCRLVTRWTPPQVERFEHDIASGYLHPRDAKMQLAFEITANFYSDAEAQKAQEAFVRLFQQRDVPVDIPEFKYDQGLSVLDVLAATGLITSKNEGRRLIEQKGVRLNGEVLDDGMQPLHGGGVLQVGKRHFIKVVPN
ncbi:MAG: tyrosine--tRNA ligase [Anaerolineaceae bacterium]|nr:tyrosine--tRNA ligase [Anaerolineaceae bacterium]